MKKILTILAATATMFAFGAVNGDTTISRGADFEANAFTPGQTYSTLDVNLGANYNDENVAGTPRYWYTTDTDAANVISNYTQAAAANVPIESRPDLFAENDNTKYLQVETTGRLYRSVNDNAGTGDFLTNTTDYAWSVTDNQVYLDTLVKFTAADSVFGDDALENGDKIAIEYVEHESEGGDDDTVTNFVIRAGYVTGTGADANVVQTNYFVAPPSNFDKDAWHRLTVRTISDVGDGTIGFVIYLDQALLKYSADVAAGDAAFVDGLNNDVSSKFYNDEDAAVGHALFPSVVRTGAAKTTITAAAFSGNGALDDVVFTTRKPEFIQETALVTVKWDTNKVTGVTLNTTSSRVLTPEEVLLGEVAIEPVNSSVGFSVTFAAGYELGTCTVTPATSGGWDGANSFTNLKSGAVCNIGAMKPYFTVNGVKYENFADALAVATGETAAQRGTVKVYASYTGDIEVKTGYVTIDLAGQTLAGTTDASIINDGADLIITNSTATIGHITTGTASQAILLTGGSTTITAGWVDGEAFIDGGALTLTGGYYYDVNRSTDVADFYLALPGGATIADTVSYVGDPAYYFQVGGGDTPQPTTYALTIPTVTGASATVTDKATSSVIADLTAIEDGTVVTVTWTAEEGYKITAGATEEITMSENKTAAVPTVSAITYATLTITQVANCTIVVSNATAEVASGTKFDVADTVQLTVYRAPADGYVLDNCAATETITMDQDQTVTAAVKVSGGYPTYIDTEDAAMKAKYDTWAQTYGADTASAYEAAFLLNIAPDAEDQTLKPTAITMEGGKVVITANQTLTSVNGKVYVKVATTLAGLSTAEWAEATLSAGKVQVTPGSSDTAGFYKIKVDFAANNPEP